MQQLLDAITAQNDLINAGVSLSDPVMITARANIKSAQENYSVVNNADLDAKIAYNQIIAAEVAAYRKKK